jgi:peptidoglycan/LPS O-acetylase OafA/YrhL
MSTLPLSAAVSPAPQSDAPAAANVRLLGLDAVRFLAIAGIVWRHAAETTSDAPGFFGVPFFLIVSLLLLGRSVGGRSDEPVLPLLRRRAARLYVPFLFWCVVYEGLRQAKALRHGEFNTDALTPYALLGGTARHLWFLPFLLLCMCVAIPLLTWAARSIRRGTIIGVVAVVAAAVVIALPVPTKLTGTLPPDQEFSLSFYQAVPAALLGLGLATVLGLSKVVTRWGYAVGVIGLIGVVLTTAGQWRLAEPTLLLSTLGGIAAWLVAGSPLSGVATLAWLGRLSFGIYLSHVVFLRVIAQVAAAKHVGPSPALDAAAFAVALGGSAILTLALRRSKYTRWTIGD